MSENAQNAPMRFPLPAVLLAGAIGIGMLGNALYPLPWVGRPLSDVLMMIGAITMLAGLAVIFAAIRRMTRERTTVRPDRPAHRLVTDGIFAVSRNPIYLGMAMGVFGLAFLTGASWFILTGIAFCLILQKLAIEPEERHLDERFGKRFRDYRKRVRRWI
jgi:protein-S-isoprenylcysteine O-methyltransferase Ste14